MPTSNYSGTASVTCSDSSVTVPATLTFKNGVATFQVTVGAIGTETFTVTDTTTATITGTTTIDVVAAPKAMQYGVNILSPPPNSMGSGSSGTGSGSTGLTSGTGTSQLPPPPPGQGGSSSMGSSGSGSNQLPPPPPPPPPPSGTTPNVTAGTTVTVQVVALDAKGNPVPNYTGTATVASSDTSVTVPSSIMFTDGVATFQVTLSTAESETLTVTSSDGTIDGSVTVNRRGRHDKQQLDLQQPVEVGRGGRRLDFQDFGDREHGEADGDGQAGPAGESNGRCQMDGREIGSLSPFGSKSKGREDLFRDLWVICIENEQASRGADC